MKNALLFIIFCLSLGATTMNVAFAQDSDFVRAKKTLDQIDNGIKYLKTGDVKTYNALSAKLTSARTLLQSTTSKTDQEYNTLINRWNADSKQLIEIANLWKNPPAQKETEKAQPATKQESAAQVSNQDKSAAQPTTTAAVSKQDSSAVYNSLINKYQRENRPNLPADSSAEQAVTWADQMMNLIGAQMEQDTKVAEQQLNKQDKNRFDRWVRGTWHEQILEQMTAGKQTFENNIARAIEQADFINNAGDDDKNKILNIGGEEPYALKKGILNSGLESTDIATKLDQALNQPNAEMRNTQQQKIEKALVRLDMFKEKEAVLSKEIAAMPERPKKKLTSQKLWLNGYMFCEITRKGEVWKNSTFVGTIGDDGDIWISASGNGHGSIEDDGKVWHSGNHVGTLMENGDVWKGGNKVGSINKEGKVWYGTSPETVEGPGDWRRAAILYFFDFY